MLTYVHKRVSICCLDMLSKSRLRVDVSSSGSSFSCAKVLLITLSSPVKLNRSSLEGLMVHFSRISSLMVLQNDFCLDSSTMFSSSCAQSWVVMGNFSV